MSEEAAPERIAVIWSPEARAGLRATERETAMQILRSLDRYLATRAGDVKKLKPPRAGFRLRCGDYRIFFDLKEENTIEITGVKDRREAYRSGSLSELGRASLVAQAVFDRDGPATALRHAI